MAQGPSVLDRGHAQCKNLDIFILKMGGLDLATMNRNGKFELVFVCGEILPKNMIGLGIKDLRKCKKGQKKLKRHCKDHLLT